MGIGALAVACVFMIGWVRSIIFWDEITFISPWWQGFNTVHTDGNGIIWHRVTGEGVGYIPGWLSGRSETPVSDPYFSSVAEISWLHQLWFLDFGVWMWKGQLGVRAQFIRIPYWSIVIPLTLLSAWLLLSKPRQPIKPKVSQKRAA